MSEAEEAPKDIAKLREYSWLVRSCDDYAEEYKECRRWKSRFHQYFIFGEKTDCSGWDTDYRNCLVYIQKRDDESLGKLVASEKARIHARLRPHVTNSVWELRDAPPANWNEPLREDLQKRAEDSYMNYAKKREEEEKKENTEQNTQKPFCAIT